MRFTFAGNSAGDLSPGTYRFRHTIDPDAWAVALSASAKVPTKLRLEVGACVVEAEVGPGAKLQRVLDTNQTGRGDVVVQLEINNLGSGLKAV